MKTLKVKYLLIDVVALFCAMFLMHSTAFAQTPTSPTTPANIQQEKTDVKSHITEIKYYRGHLAFYKAKYKIDNANGWDKDAMVDQQKITQAKGDLAMEKAYLKASKDMLVEDYDRAIHAQRAAVRLDRDKLANAKIKLSNDLAAIDEVSDKDAHAVVMYERELANDKVALDQKIIHRNSDILAVNKEIKKCNGEFLGSIYTEDAIASTQDFFVK